MAVSDPAKKADKNSKITKIIRSRRKSPNKGLTVLATDNWEKGNRTIHLNMGVRLQVYR